jgi:phage tail P2-like protein
MVKLLQDFEPIFKKYIDDMDMSSIMVYMVDLVHADALPYLAEQFNVAGYRGWDLATTEAARRELIKNAIQIQRKVGTPYAIKQALKAIGFANVTITENVAVGNYYNGTYNYNGLINYTNSGGADQWVNFGVTVKVADPATVSEQTRTLIRLLIDEYKPARSMLVYTHIETI